MAKFLRFVSVDRDRLNLRAWFALYCVYMTVVVLLSLWGCRSFTESGTTWGEVVCWVGMYVFYFSLACTFVPLPTSWFVLFLASPQGPLDLNPIFRVALVAAIGGAATGIAHLNEYHVISYLLQLGKIHRVRETRIYIWAENIFKTSPFMLQMWFNVVPVPADPVRWLAIIYRYPRVKFFLAHASGRTIRYGVLAVAAVIFALSARQIVIIQMLLVILAIGKIFLPRLRSVRVITKPAEEQTT
jgi:membrane protein YqaA with SNARE-associated domain